MAYDFNKTYVNSTIKSTLFLSVMKQVKTKYEKAKEIGDEETVKELETYYENAKNEDFFIENPSKGKDGKKRFCFINRKKGFINIDEELTENDINLLDILKSYKISFYQLTDEESYNKFLTEYYSLGWEKLGIIIIQFPNIDGDKLFFVNNNNYISEENVSEYFLALGFDKVEIGYYYNQLNPDKSEGEVTLSSSNMQNPGKLFFIKSEYVRYKLNIGQPVLNINHDNSEYQSKTIMECKEYKDTFLLPPSFYITLNGEKITDLSKIRAVYADNKQPVEISEKGDGVFNFKIKPTHNADIWRSANSSSTIEITYNSDDVGEIKTTFYANTITNYDVDRLELVINDISYSGGQTTVNFTIKDTYYPEKSNTFTNVNLFIKGFCEAIETNVSNNTGVAVFSTIPEQTDYVVYLCTSTYNGGRIASAEFTK